MNSTENKPSDLTWNIAVFASGNGSNAEKLFEYFESNKKINISLLLSNNQNAFAIKRAENHKIPTLTFNREDFYHTQKIANILASNKIHLIVLAGFLWKIPEYLIKQFPNKIINIHPALLPKFGGKGMYGKYVHEAVVDAKEKSSGITIHFINEQYDEGQIIFQASVDLLPTDTPEMVAKKVLELEHMHYPKIVEKVLEGFK